MSLLQIPQKYYAKEGYFSGMGLGYTAALATVAFTVVNMVMDRNFSMEMMAAIVGGSLATWGYLKESDLDYAQS